MSIARQTVKAVMAATLPRRLLLVRGPSVVSNTFSRDAEASERSACSVRAPLRKASASRLNGTATQLAAVALTFDDGPHPEHTPRLLDRLAEQGIVATFFVVGVQAKRHPALVRRLVDEGHELGNHTYTHLEPDRTTASRFVKEIRVTRAVLEDISGRPCTLVRPPLGKLSFGKLWGLWRDGQTVVLWNIDPRDYRMRSDDEMDRWCTRYRPHGGDIVLLHDNRPYAERAIKRFAQAEWLPHISFVRVSDWVAKPQAATATGPIIPAVG